MFMMDILGAKNYKNKNIKTKYKHCIKYFKKLNQ